MHFIFLQYIYNISIHALREERDINRLVNRLTYAGFQSTRSARSATYYRYWIRTTNRFQSTRSARSATSGNP